MRGKRGSYWIIGLFVVLLMLAGYKIPSLRFNYDFEAFFPEQDEVLDFYNFFRKQFAPDDNFVLVAVSSPEGSVYDTSFLQRIDRLTRVFDTAIPHIKQARSITLLQRPVIAAGMVIQRPVIHLHNAAKLALDSARIHADPRLVDRFVSRNGRHLAIVLETGPRLSLDQAYAMRDALQQALQTYGFENARIAGRSYYQAALADKAKQEFLHYTLISAIILLIVLILLFRRFWGVCIAMISVLVALCLFVGGIAWSGLALDPMSNLFPILLIIVGISDVIHLMNKYIYEQRKGIAKERAIRITIREVGMATLLTSVTTAIGLMSLLTSNIQPIRQFGWIAALGVMLTFVTVIVLTPALLRLFPAAAITRPIQKSTFWDTLMHRIFWLTARRKVIILSATVIVTILSLGGISLISTNTKLADGFPKDDKIGKDFQFLEKSFGGVRNMEIAILPQGAYKVDDQAILQATASLSRYLNQHPAMASPLSPATIYQSIHQALRGDNPDYYTIPADTNRFHQVVRYAERIPENDVLRLMSADRQYGRLSLKYRDIGADSGRVLRSQIQSWINAHIDTQKVQFTITGTSLLFDVNSRYVRTSMLQGLGLAFIIVSIVMIFLFRNWKLIVISLVPNVIPLLITGALLGVLGIALDAATSIIFAIAFGIAVDDTIHFLSRFRLEKQKKRNNPGAIKATLKESGKAITLTSIILFMGFIVLLTSAYPPTYYVGLMVSITLAAALVIDLLLTPVLIYLLLGKE